jgi:hypothetical protein
MRLEEALELIRNLSQEELMSLSPDTIIYIVSEMTPVERGQFFLEKNIKAFGGIDEYVKNFLEKFNLNSLNVNGKSGARDILNKMLAYPGISEKSKQRVEVALTRTYNIAPAAGGKRSKTRRKNKGLKRNRVRK